MVEKYDNPIAFLDSGVGGISVLNEAIKMMPHENYIYFGDSKNAPYGIKTTAEVRNLTEKNVEFLLEQGAKAIVIACNTATSAAAEYLRNKYKDIPIIGVEPALKPAALNNEGEKILVMATPMTLAERKFRNLMNKYEEYATIIPVPCGGLMEFVENGKLQGEELEAFLDSLLDRSLCEHVKAVVLGCTHYPFIKESIVNVIGHEVDIYDGGLGTARQLQRKLRRNKILRPEKELGQVRILNTLNEDRMIKLSEKLLIKAKEH
ncbi:glutamate racemase [Aminipila luticellarii]|uniref:Glutamate racemase n=1 Tax=Aminipila luticellarii TaxID=2507160 RepID=A0A410PXK0_9FIRM|nr:glutamate racemase [Aminipila luticellarii]QAT43614.1 glutamate racemase [Aminipila luticellarii]HBM80275.1 glutamate racemase [Clostridiaceae bacterium]